MSLGVLGLLSLTLVSCSKTYNTSVAYGNLSDNKTYASSNGKSISEKKLYDMMRSSAYDTVKKSIKEQLFSDILPVYKDGALTNTKYFNYIDTTNADAKAAASSRNLEKSYGINKNIVNAIFGVTTVEAYKAITPEDANKSITRYVDSLFTQGIKKDDGTYFIKSDIESLVSTITFEFDENGDEVFAFNVPYTLYKTYIYDIALESYALEQLSNPEFDYYYGNKYIPGSGANSFYVTEDDVQSYYYASGKNFRSYKGIVIKFTSQASAKRIINSALGRDTIDSSNALNDYINIYNLRYATRDDIDDTLSDRYNNLSVTKKKNNFAEYDSSLLDIFKEMEDGEYFSKIQNIGGTYYLMYRASGEDILEWEELPENEKKPGEGTVYSEMLDYILKDKSISTLVSIIEKKRFEDIVDNKSIEIFDPVYAYKFGSDYTDFAKTTTSNNDYVYKFTYDSKEYSLTPTELYEKIEPLYGVNKAVDYLTEQYYLSLTGVESLIKKDDVDAISDNLKKEINSFKDGKKNYSKTLGVPTYLQLTYGLSTREEVIESKKAALISNVLSKFYGDFTSVNDNKTFNNTAPLFKNFEAIYKDLYDSYFSATISHILIAIDENGDGNYANPAVYRNSLPTAALKDKYDETLLTLVNAIIDEVKALTKSLKVKEALDYIVEAYNNNYKIGSLSYAAGSDVYWNSLKREFPIVLKAEDLGEIDLFKAANYVEPFSTRVKEIWDKVEADEIKEEDIEDKGVFEFNTEFTLASDMLDSICTTSYGYHILNIYDTGEASSALFKAASDSKVKDEDEYKQYEHLEVVIIPDDAAGKEDDDDDPEYVLYTNGYSDNDYASVNQLFVYFYEDVVMGSHGLLKSSVKNAISSMFDGALSFYTGSSFAKWRLLKYQMNDLKFADAKNNVTALYLTYLENALYNYAKSNKYTLYTDYIDTAKYNWALDYSWNR